MKQTVVELKADLELVKAEIENHPYNSPEMKAANQIIESHSRKDESEISRELAEKQLPRLEELGLITVKGLRSFANLHRSRVRLEAKIAKAETRK